MALGSGILSGKKTYIVAGLGVLGSIAAYLTGDITLGSLITALIASISAATLRNGITNETSK